jgi:hypothetical protein
LEELRAQEFDIGLSFAMPADQLIFRYLELPFMSWAAFTPYVAGAMFGFSPI